MIFVSSLFNYCFHKPEVLICVKLKIEFNTEASFHIPINEDGSTPINNIGVWSTGHPVPPYYGKLTPDQVSCCKTAVKLDEAFRLVLTQCLPAQTRTRFAGTGGTRLRKRVNLFQHIMSDDGCATNSDRQCVPQLVFSSHRRFYQKATELQNVPIAMTIFMARPTKLFS
jgi:hypothetical protein